MFLADPGTWTGLPILVSPHGGNPLSPLSQGCGRLPVGQLEKTNGKAGLAAYNVAGVNHILAIKLKSENVDNIN